MRFGFGKTEEPVMTPDLYIRLVRYLTVLGGRWSFRATSRLDGFTPGLAGKTIWAWVSSRMIATSTLSNGKVD